VSGWAEDWSGRRLHFVAIGGAGMSGLALVAHSLGAAVSGSDRAQSSYMERLRAAGLDPKLDHDADQVPAEAEVVVSSAIPEDNPELRIARERGQRVIHRGELLAELGSLRRLLAVAGTHGKTTTAAMCVHALRETGADPCFLIGGELPGAGPGGASGNAGWGDGEWIVAEADESDASFLELRPEVAVITNLELDHHSRWSSLEQLRNAFARFCEPAASVAIGAGVRLPAAGQGEQRRLRFGLEDEVDGEAELLASELRSEPGGGIGFRAIGPLGRQGAEGALQIRLAVPGRHNVANALATLAGLAMSGADPEAAAQALESFPGVARRLELKGSREGALVYDDYAHHPTEVAAVLEAARELRPRRLFAVFQPHLYSRTKALAAEFGAALSAADEVAVLDVYPAREQPTGPLEGVSGRMVAAATADRAGGKPVWWLPDTAQAAAALGPRLGEGDLVLTIGAGDIFKLAEQLVEEAP
jgi:UDP-N-acetylmuramate--alanine ligase